MSSIDKYFNLQSQQHGFDDVGFNGPSGSITAASDAGLYSPVYAGKTLLTMSAAHGYNAAGPIQIAGTTDYDGANRVVKVVPQVGASTKLIINKPFTTTKTGTWSMLGGLGAWDGFRPIGADLPATNITALTFYDAGAGEGGNELSATAVYKQDNIYPFPGVIKTILIATAGNIRLIRSATIRPKGVPTP